MKMYEIQKAQLLIEEAQIRAATDALYLPKFPTAQYALAPLLLENLEGWGFHASLNAQGDLNVTGYRGEEVDVNDVHVLRTFFFKLAPYVASGGSIELWNEEENDMRWRFEQGKLQQQSGLTSWATIE